MDGEGRGLADKARIKSELLRIRADLKSLCGEIMEAQGVYYEPRGSLIEALRHMNNAANCIWMRE